MVLVVWVYYLSYLMADPLCALIFQHQTTTHPRPNSLPLW